jgi:cyclopropane fatty-acyl-phospholipid synthase-like methyltransferase
MPATETTEADSICLDSEASGLESAADRKNNPYCSTWAQKYERVLSVPPIKQIRASEERTLRRLIDATLRPSDTLLEIGPGTGRATVEFAARVSHVTAVEQSPEMVCLLEQRLRHERVQNCRVLTADFRHVDFPQAFDVVALIGVLDYIPEPEPFLQHAARLASRALIFTTPHCGTLARLHRAGNRLRGVAISTYTARQLEGYLGNFDVEIHETGLRTRLWRGMTLACRAVRR